MSELSSLFENLFLLSLLVSLFFFIVCLIVWLVAQAEGLGPLQALGMGDGGLRSPGRPVFHRPQGFF